METKSIAIQPSNSLPSTQRGTENFPMLNAAFLMIISFVIFSAIVAPVYAYILKWKKHSLSFKPRYQVPCHQCRYFGGNPYLRCALHPITVLTEQAIDCADYCSSRKVKQVKE